MQSGRIETSKQNCWIQGSGQQSVSVVAASIYYIVVVTTLVQVGTLVVSIVCISGSISIVSK